ncbi:hypothetical protein R1sor_004242 [Riccia sorocarpa]|uniref:Small auxin up regulated protein n=1 Tax=Riccia sorocarpa TaxID=122646 RepID=A0ABD3H3Y8_9MARC
MPSTAAWQPLQALPVLPAETCVIWPFRSPGRGDKMVTLNRISKSSNLGGPSSRSRDAEGGSPNSLKPNFLSTNLSRGSFSWSFVMRIALLSANSNTALSSSLDVDSECRCNDDSALAGPCLSEGPKNSFKLISLSFLRKSGSSSSSRRKSAKSCGRKPLLLEKIPFGKAGKYITVYVGQSSDQSVKYVISRRLLAHPLFQVLLKCSEDEFGEEYGVNDGVAVICDPALFVELVRAIDKNHWSVK